MTRPVYSPKVEALYRVWVEWDIKGNERGDKDVCDVTKALKKLKHPKNVCWTDDAGACWTAQIVITGYRRDSVEKFAHKVLRLFARYKNLTIYSGAKIRAGT